jgi:hypothetical protein
MRPERLEWALPKFLNAPDLDTRVPAWGTAHGDLHWANLTGPQLTLLDRERWGRAPLGYDAAHLYISSLTEPSTAAPSARSSPTSSPRMPAATPNSSWRANTSRAWNAATTRSWRPLCGLAWRYCSRETDE